MTNLLSFRLAVLILPLLALARDPAEAWLRVTATAPRTELRVRTFDGGSHRGMLVKAGPDELRLNVEGQERSLARGEISRVQVYLPSRRIRNLLIGAGIGAAVGIVGAFGACPSCAGEYAGDEYRWLLTKGGLAGAALGAGLSQIAAPYRTIYKGKRPRR